MRPSGQEHSGSIKGGLAKAQKSHKDKRGKCAGCGVAMVITTYGGQERRYHDNACRQRAYRERKAEEDRQFRAWLAGRMASMEETYAEDHTSTG